MTFTVEQTRQLLAPINPKRVLADGKGHSHVSQQDVTAHLIRVFGFGSFATEILSLEVVYEKPRDPAKTGARDRWDVCYRAALRLTIMDKDGTIVCSYEDASTGECLNSVLSDAHDLALKSALSVAKKRCAVNLGDQFGLSLYNKGQTSALVMGTKVLPRGYDEKDVTPDLQEDVTQQVSLGTDETVHDDHVVKSTTTEPTAEQEKMLKDSLGAEVIEETTP